MKHFKRFISIILALLMIISSAPLTALADEEEPEAISGHYEDPNNDDYSFDWTYDETDTLYLDGKIISSVDIEDDDGETYTFLPLFFTYDGQEQIFDFGFSNVVFSKKVEVLDEYCLGYDEYDGRMLNISFEEGSSLKRIYTHAFSGYYINELVLPDSLEFTNNYAFSYSVFNYVSLPNAETNIGPSAFYNSNIDDFDFNNCRINKISSGMFHNAKLNNFEIPGYIETIKSQAFKNATFSKDLVIPASIETIEQSAFYNAKFQKISFESQVSTIGASAFGMSKANVDSSYSYDPLETNVDGGSFTGCNIQITQIESSVDRTQHSVSGFYDDENDEYDLTWSYDNDSDTLYLNAKTVKSINTQNKYYGLPLYYTNENGKKILWKGTYHNVVFSKNVIELNEDCLGITNWDSNDYINVSFEDNSKLERIYKAFIGAKVERLTLPNTVYEIGEKAFHYSYLNYIKLPHYTGNKEPTFGEYAFSDCFDLEVDFNGFNVKILSPHLFENSEIKIDNLPNSIEEIGYYSFYAAEINNDFYVSSNVKNIFGYAFQNAVFNGSFEFAPDVDGLWVYDYALSGTNLTSIYIPANICLTPYIFSNCTSLKYVDFDDNYSRETLSGGLFENCTELTSINIPSSIEIIPYNAFYNCKKLKYVNFESDSQLTEIYDNAFYNCLKLQNISIPEGVKNIYASAFKACSSLKYVYLPTTLEYLGKEVFNGDSLLSNINIPSRLSEIPEGTFENCISLNITIPDNITSIGSKAFYNCFSLGGIIDNINNFGDLCLYNTKITEIDLSNLSSQISIGKYAFSNCDELQYANLNNENIESLDVGTFKGANILERIILPDNLTQIPDEFAMDTALLSISLPETIESIGEYAFCGVNIRKITIPFATTSIGKYAFSACYNLSNVDFENIEERTSRTIIYYYAFYECISLKSIELPEGSTGVTDYCFAASGLESISLPSSSKGIGIGAFAGTPIKHIIIPGNVTVLHKNAFTECIYLESVEFSPNSTLTKIESECFKDCTSLSKITFPATLKTIDKAAFSNCNLKTIETPESCTNIGENAFEDNPLISATIKNKSTTIGKKSLFYDPENDTYTDSGVIYGHNPSTAKSYAASHSILFLQINTSGESEDDEEFISLSGSYQGGVWNISGKDEKTLVISGNNISSLSIIDENSNETTFANLVNDYKISRVYIGNGITTIPDYFLYDESGVGVNFVRLPNSLKSIGAHAFDGTSVIAFYNSARAGKINDGIYSSYIPQNVTHIGEYAFAHTDSLNAEFKLPKDLTEIPEGLFYRSGVHNVSMYGRVTKIGKKAFADCENMTSLYVPCSVTEIYADNDINNSAFGYAYGKVNGNLLVLTRSGSVGDSYSKSLGLHTSDYLGVPYREGKFADSSSTLYTSQMEWKYYIEDNSLVLSPVASNMTVYTNAKKFYEYYPDSNSTSLRASTIDASIMNLKPDKVTLDRILEFSCPDFLSVFNPKEIQVYNSLRLLGERSFADCERVEEIHLPMAFSNAGTYCFSGCTSLKQVSLGYGVAKIEEGLFNECRNLEAVDLGNVVLQNIGQKAFYNCNKLKFVNLKNITSYNRGTIGDYAFYNCVNLQEINIPDNIKTIGTKAFYNCIQAQQINISGNVETIGKDAFANIFYCERINLNSEINSNAITNEREIFANLGSYTNGIEVNIGNSVQNLDCKFFDGLKITKLNLGSSVNNLENKQYLGMLSEITADNNETYSVIDKGLYNSAGDVLVLYPQSQSDVKIAQTAKYISDYALYKTNAKSITLPDSIEAIGVSSFADSETLVGITLSENISEIPKNAFKGCTKLRLLNLPESVLAIRESAFEGCTSLVSAVFNASLDEIGKNAFKGCVKLEGLAFPENLSRIDEGAFENCSKLKYAYIWHTLIGNNAFNNCSNISLFMPVRTDAYRYAREFQIPYSAYTDEDLFYDEWAIKIDALAGYLGYCEEDGHGDIQYLTVYQADCEHDGFVIGVCEYCSEILEEIHIDAYGHKYNVETCIPPTETTRGITVSTCERCHQTKTTYEPPLDESFEKEVHTVSGKIEIAADRKARTGIAPVKNASITIDGMVVATTDENGDFSLELETGSYIAQIKYAYGFTRTIYIVVKNEDIEYENPIAIVGCDFSKDGVINDEDVTLFQMIISAKKDDPSYLSFVDLNGDGYINVKDLLYIKAFNVASASEFAYRQIIIV